MKDFEFDKDPSPPGTAHFTQIVWKSTKQLGIGRAIIRRRNSTCTYFVARYAPAGNWVGKFKDEVRKGDFNEGVCKNLTKIIKDAVGDLSEDDDADDNDQSKAKPVSDDDDDDDDNKGNKVKKPPLKPTERPSKTQASKKPTTASPNAPPQGLPNSLNSSECNLGSIEGNEMIKFSDLIFSV